MEQFAGKLAVITGGGTGMGRELARQLAAEGCHVALCDVSDDTMAETRQLCEESSPPGTTVTTFVADVSDESQLLAFRDHVMSAHDTDHIDLLFNNAGIGGGASMISDERDEWDAVFGVCWGGVYLGTRTFLPLLLRSSDGHVVNTSSVNGFWACLGANAHTAYSAAKFAVKGFTEALVVDFRQNAPHLKASVVMPGHIGTSIVYNSGRYFGRDPKNLGDDQVAQVRERFSGRGLDLGSASDEDVRQLMVAMADGFRDHAPTTAAQAATIILDGVRAGEWRILVGDDAHQIDELVRERPVDAYEPDFLQRLHARGAFQFIPTSPPTET
jgi:NAD(P)-dependent dehydrogenase (short-subunit alcohol dehydrogenase family)